MKIIILIFFSFVYLNSGYFMADSYINLNSGYSLEEEDGSARALEKQLFFAICMREDVIVADLIKKGVDVFYRYKTNRNSDDSEIYWRSTFNTPLHCALYEWYLMYYHRKIDSEFKEEKEALDNIINSLICAMSKDPSSFDLQNSAELSAINLSKQIYDELIRVNCLSEKEAGYIKDKVIAGVKKAEDSAMVTDNSLYVGFVSIYNYVKGFGS